MLWFFDREHDALQLETRYDNETFEFVATVRYPNGRERTERFVDGERFREWLVTFERHLERERWLARSGPIFLPYGWPVKPQQ